MRKASIKRWIYLVRFLVIVASLDIAYCALAKIGEIIMPRYNTEMRYNSTRPLLLSFEVFSPAFLAGITDLMSGLLGAMALDMTDNRTSVKGSSAGGEV